MDLSGCNLEKLASREAVIDFVDKLCKLIDMKKFGETFCERFGLGLDHAAGYSVVQLIESSSITGHFSELWRKAYINVFSCKKFDPEAVKKFTQEFFEAKEVKNRFLIR